VVERPGLNLPEHVLKESKSSLQVASLFMEAVLRTEYERGRTGNFQYFNELSLGRYLGLFLMDFRFLVNKNCDEWSLIRTRSEQLSRESTIEKKFP